MEFADQAGAQRAGLQFKGDTAVRLARSGAGGDHLAFLGDQAPEPFGAVIGLYGLLQIGLDASPLLIHLGFITDS